jgi:peptide/nickel transport system substrate-binding protein
MPAIGFKRSRFGYDSREMRRLALLVTLAALGCAKAAPRPKDGIVIGISQEPDTLWMPMKQMNASEHVGRPGALSLTVFDDAWRLVPQAAVEIPTLANGGVVLAGDGTMRVTWKLRDGLFWADGVAVTADDFVFTQQLYEDDNLEIVDRTVSDRVKTMRAIDARTLEVTFKEPYAYYAVFRNHEVVPRHIVEPLWKAKGAALKQDRFGQEPVLGGAFTVSPGGAWVPGDHITVVANPYARGGPFAPRLASITWKIIPDTAALEANLLAGSIDAIGVIGLTFDQALALQARLPAERFEVVFTDALMLEHIDFNLDNPILADKRVRTALLYAADRAGVVHTLFADKLAVAEGNEPPRSRYHANVAPRAFDVDKAAALLDEAGWKLPASGGAVREKSGAPLRLTLMSTAGDKTRENVEQILVASWKKAGVDVVVQNQPAKVLFGETVRHRKFDGMVMFAWSHDPLQINESLWRCDQVPREQNGFKGMNYPGYCNAAVDELLRQMVHELDDDKRAVLGQKLDAILADDLPMLPLYFRQEVSVKPKGFKGWRPTGLFESMAWNAQEWSF